MDPITPALALQVFMVAVAVGGMLNMFAVHLIKTDYASFVEHEADWDGRHQLWTFPWVQRILGADGAAAISYHTALFPCFELLFGLTIVVALWNLGLSAEFVRAAIFAVLGFPLALISMLTEEEGWITPDVITLPGVVIGLITSIAPGVSGEMRLALLIAPYLSYLGVSPGGVLVISALLDSALGAALAFGILYLANLMQRLRKHEEGVGLGAMKAMTMAGAFCGWQGVFPVLLISTVAGLVPSLYRALVRRARLNSQISFTMYLVLGAIVVMIWKAQIVAIFDAADAARSAVKQHQQQQPQKP